MRNGKLSRLGLLLTAAVWMAMWPCRSVATSVLTLTVGGTPMEIVLSEHPVITYKGDALHIKTNDTVIDVPVSEIDGGSFDRDIATSIRPVEQAEMQAQGGELRFSQLAPGSRVEVFSMGGSKLCDVAADANGRATVALGSLPKGACIVKSGSKTIKIVNK